MFQHGFYGEIVPEPLVENREPSELVDWLFENYEMGMERAETEALTSIAFLTYHKWRMIDLFEHPASERERTLARAVTEGQAINIAPACFLSQAQFFRTFAPVFQRVGEGRYRVGVPNFGHCQEIQAASPIEAMKEALELVDGWVTVELDLQ